MAKQKGVTPKEFWSDEAINQMCEMLPRYPFELIAITPTPDVVFLEEISEFMSENKINKNGKRRAKSPKRKNRKSSAKTEETDIWKDLEDLL